MSRQKTEINPIRAERLKILIDREKSKNKDLTQAKFAKKIFQSQQNVSRIINLKNALTEETAKDIIKAYPEYRIEWLLGFDDIMLKEELQENYVRRSDATNTAVIQILDSALREVCAREGIKEIPTLDNIPELLLLDAQIRDFADSLMWNYVKNRKHSHLWSYLDQISGKEKYQT